MAFRGWTSLPFRLALVLCVLGVLFVAVVYLTVLDARSMRRTVEHEVEIQNDSTRAHLAAWYAAVDREYARQLAAPFLWNVETLEGVHEGTAVFSQIQRRMWQFVYGRETAPILVAQPVGPLESVVIVDLDHRIVAASDVMAVDRRFTDPEDLRLLDAALTTPQVRRIEGQRADGKPVYELSAAVPNSHGVPIGVVRLRYVGGTIAAPPALPVIRVTTQPRLWGPVLAGFLAVVGMAFGALATYEVVSLTRHIEAMAQGAPLPPHRTGVGARALSLIEERLEALSDTVRREDQWVASVAEALREGVLLLDRQGRLVVANRQARRICGLGEGDAAALGASFEALRHGNPDLDHVVDASLGGRRAVSERPTVVLLSEGRRVAVQLTTYVLHDAKNVTGVLLVIKDRASIEGLERNLREASRLQAIVQLTDSVAHEVKNPLGAIGIHLENLRRRLVKQKDPDPAAEERVQIIRDEIHRLRDILEEWLRLTSPDDRVPRATPVGSILASVARLLRVEARHQHVELVVEQEGPPVMAALGPAALRQVLLNLCLNALQAMPEGGRLCLRCTPKNDLVDFEVEDTGVGIADAVRERIFDMHFTTRTDGSGLGLAICKRLVEEAGGVITFTSVEGKGTTFRVRLPQVTSLREPRPAAEGG